MGEKMGLCLYMRTLCYFIFKFEIKNHSSLLGFKPGTAVCSLVHEADDIPMH